eukprot:Selendium_serpulae@DN3535_c0_g1_i1.p1
MTEALSNKDIENFGEAIQSLRDDSRLGPIVKVITPVVAEQARQDRSARVANRIHHTLQLSTSDDRRFSTESNARTAYLEHELHKKEKEINELKRLVVQLSDGLDTSNAEVKYLKKIYEHPEKGRAHSAALCVGCHDVLGGKRGSTGSVPRHNTVGSGNNKTGSVVSGTTTSSSHASNRSREARRKAPVTFGDVVNDGRSIDGTVPITLIAPGCSVVSSNKMIQTKSEAGTSNVSSEKGRRNR